MENIENQLSSKEPEVTYWTDLHTCHLNRKIESMMLDPGGRTLFINCILKHESPRSPGGAKKRRVIFDKNFILYRLLTLLSVLEFYEVKFLLKELLNEMEVSKNKSQIYAKLCLSPYAVDTSEEEGTSTDLLEDPIFASFLDEIEDEVENDTPLVVDTEESVVRVNVGRKGKKKNG